MRYVRFVVVAASLVSLAACTNSAQPPATAPAPPRAMNISKPWGSLGDLLAPLDMAHRQALWGTLSLEEQHRAEQTLRAYTIFTDDALAKTGSVDGRWHFVSDGPPRVRIEGPDVSTLKADVTLLDFRPDAGGTERKTFSVHITWTPTGDARPRFTLRMGTVETQEFVTSAGFDFDQTLQASPDAP